MQDALLCYYLVMNMCHAGYFRIVADLLLRAKARCRAIRGVADLVWKGCANAGGAPWSPTTSRMPTICRMEQDWPQRLLRLESYVAAMT